MQLEKNIYHGENRMISINKVKDFWEENPLWTGESQFEEGTLDFFQEHRKVYHDDCFAGSFDIRFLPPPRKCGQGIMILDLGCGIGFWTRTCYAGLFKHSCGLLKALEITKQDGFV